MSRTIKQPYTGSKRFDVTCRCHGSCLYCRDNRTYSAKHRAQLSDVGDPSNDEIIDDIEIDEEMNNSYADDL